MLAYYVEWTMVKALAPFLSDDEDTARTGRPSPVQQARRSRAARAKAAGKRTPDGIPVHSFQTLLANPATLPRNRVQPTGEGAVAADVLASPTPLHAEAFRLLNVQPRNVPSSIHPLIADNYQYHNSLAYTANTELRERMRRRWRGGAGRKSW